MGLVGLVCGGVFEKFPKLRVAFFECSAEWILYWMHRIDDDFEFMKHGFSDLKTLPSDLIRRFEVEKREALDAWSTQLQ